MTTKWEYLYVAERAGAWLAIGPSDADRRDVGETIMEMLETVGADGWELVSTPSEPNIGPWVFTRPKTRAPTSRPRTK